MDQALILAHLSNQLGRCPNGHHLADAEERPVTVIDTPMCPHCNALEKARKKLGEKPKPGTFLTILETLTVEETNRRLAGDSDD